MGKVVSTFYSTGRANFSIKMTDTTQKENHYKLIVLGGGGVGKSCLTFQLVWGKFLEKYAPTIEDAYTKEGFNVDNETYQLEILDTAGQEGFAGLRDLYYKTGHGFLIVYAVNDRSSLDDVRERFQSLLNSRGCSVAELPPVIIVGNKCDLDQSQRVVSKEDGKNLANELGGGGNIVSFAETSAKNDINVYDVFADLVRRSKIQRDAGKLEERKKKKKRMCYLLSNC